MGPGWGVCINIQNFNQGDRRPLFQKRAQIVKGGDPMCGSPGLHVSRRFERGYHTLVADVAGFSGYSTPDLKVLFDGWVNPTPDQKTAVLTIVDAFNHDRYF